MEYYCIWQRDLKDFKKLNLQDRSFLYDSSESYSLESLFFEALKLFILSLLLMSPLIKTR